MKTVYNEIEISYVEDTNTWEFVLRGRQRSTNSLTAAKEAIDKVPAEKRAPFPKFEAYMCAYSTTPKTTTVTSYAGKGYSGDEFWVSTRGIRSKERADHLFQVNDHNTQVFSELAEIEKQKKTLDEKEKGIRARLQKVVLPEMVEE